MNTAAIVSKIDSLPAYKLVYEAIEELIVSGELPTGSLLPIEGDLAQQFGVNRSRRSTALPRAPAALYCCIR